MRRWNLNAWPLAGLLVLGLTMGLGCAGLVLSDGPALDYFGTPAVGDPWSPKINGWQRRELAEQSGAPAGPSSASEVAAAAIASLDSAPSHGVVDSAPELLRPGSPDVGEAERPQAGVQAESITESLRGKYVHFRAERKRRVAREFAAWIQKQARQHYVADGPIDHWATLEETLQGDGDDCDGLELLTFHGLRDLGFRDDEVFRSIVYRPSDGQHHMVTLWFEDANDPWVIDPTGAMTPGMPRMSQLPAWVPLKVFSETAEYTVRRERAPGAVGLASNP